MENILTLSLSLSHFHIKYMIVSILHFMYIFHILTLWQNGKRNNKGNVIYIMCMHVCKNKHICKSNRQQFILYHSGCAKKTHTERGGFKQTSGKHTDTHEVKAQASMFMRWLCIWSCCLPASLPISLLVCLFHLNWLNCVLWMESICLNSKLKYVCRTSKMKKKKKYLYLWYATAMISPFLYALSPSLIASKLMLVD